MGNNQNPDQDDLWKQQIELKVNTNLQLTREILDVIKGKRHINPNDHGMLGDIEELFTITDRNATRIAKLQNKWNWAVAWLAGGVAVGSTITGVAVYLIEHIKSVK